MDDDRKADWSRMMAARIDENAVTWFLTGMVVAFVLCWIYGVLSGGCTS